MLWTVEWLEVNRCRRLISLSIFKMPGVQVVCSRIPLATTSLMQLKLQALQRRTIGCLAVFQITLARPTCFIHLRKGLSMAVVGPHLLNCCGSGTEFSCKNLWTATYSLKPNGSGGAILRATSGCSLLGRCAGGGRPRPRGLQAPSKGRRSSAHSGPT